MEGEKLSRSGHVGTREETRGDAQTGLAGERSADASARRASETSSTGGGVLPSIETERYEPSGPASRGASKRTDEGGEEEEEEEEEKKKGGVVGSPELDNNGSQHDGTDEDVFSDKSPRSSLGSYDMGSESGKGCGDPDSVTAAARSPRISDISQYGRDDEEFVPTVRGTPRPAFRTPSDVRAMQMSSSPPQSVAGGGSPRSSRRYMPTVSRLGTPTVSAQYSPRRTPDRLKPRREAPLVLLHVTLLPLRWAWADLVGGLDAAGAGAAVAAADAADVEGLSQEARAVRDAWRILRDRMGDTTRERGILLGHPQNDYEVLEERLLEALELPLRRRARILECGHYLGPSNELADDESDEDDEDDGDEADDDDYDDGVLYGGGDGGDGRPRARKGDRRHWCSTCRGDIRYETLGPRGRLFRVKVYASNGLMKAGAWAACWQEMERVDVEIEPAVGPAVQDELVRLAAARRERDVARRQEAAIAHEVEKQYREEKAEEQRRRRGEMHARVDDADDDDDDDDDDDVVDNDDDADDVGDTGGNDEIPSARPGAEAEPGPAGRSSRSSERQRRREEERTHGMYGDSPSTAEGREEHASAAAPDSYPSDSTAREPYPDSYAPSPEGAYEGGEGRRHKLAGASLPELLLESLRVFVQDQKNMAIVVLSVSVLLLAIRIARREPPYEPGIHGIIANVPEMQHVPFIEDAFHQDVAAPEVLRASVQDPEMEASGIDQAVEIQKIIDIQESLNTEEAIEVIEELISEEHAPDEESMESSITQPSIEVKESAIEPEASTEEIPVVGGVEGVALEKIPGGTAGDSQDTSSAYDACVTSTTGKDAPPVISDAPTPIATEAETEFETLTQKRTVKVFQTVIETETQFEYIKMTATEFIHQPAPTSNLFHDFDAVICKKTHWEPTYGYVVERMAPEKAESTAGVVAKIAMEQADEVEEVKNYIPEIQAAA